jgi:putative membrane protein
MPWWYEDGPVGWMGIWWVLDLVLVAVLIWAVLRAAQRPGGTTGPSESAEDVLKRRYAKGEIDRDTYQRILKDLRERG